MQSAGLDRQSTILPKLDLEAQQLAAASAVGWNVNAAFLKRRISTSSLRCIALVRLNMHATVPSKGAGRCSVVFRTVPLDDHLGCISDP